MQTEEVKTLDDKVYVDLKNEIKRTQPDVRVLPVQPERESIIHCRQLTLVGPSVDLTLLTNAARMNDEFSLSVHSLTTRRTGANIAATVLLVDYTE
ncbi:hypothetical protein [Fibrella aestuarina]|nr:hypothetical protein [Fibrella aestuarina]